MVFFILLILSILLPNTIFAQNNFGLHLTQTSDINSAHSIINSSNGDWGWATIVIRLDQINDKNTWQDFFNNCRKHHIIPIIRLATKMENNHWAKPSETDIDQFVNFLESLNWPSKTRHLILFNEINHATEWGGEVNVAEYVDIVLYAQQKFKTTNPDYFIMPAALDLAAPNQSPKFLSYQEIYRQIKNYKPEFFEKFDGLANHYYPHNSPNTYQNELLYFPNKNIPVFITETAIPHREGIKKNNNFYTLNTSVSILKNLILNYQNNSQIKAVTPFIYNYPYPPFDNFSWVDKDEKLYPQFQHIIDLPKETNEPEQITSFKKIKHEIPLIIFTGKEYYGHVYMENTGQSIWGENNFCLKSESKNIISQDLCTDEHLILPNQIKIFSFKFTVQNPSNFKEETYLKWEGLPKIKIMPINASATIYRPKTGILNIIINFIQKLIK